MIQPTVRRSRGRVAAAESLPASRAPNADAPPAPAEGEAEPEPPSPRAPGEMRRNLRCVTADGLCYSLMVGCGEAHFVAFALAMGMGQALAGLVASVPLAVGATLQLVAPRGVRRLGSHKRWVMTCAAVQGACFLPMVLGGTAGAMPAAAIFVCASLYWAAALGCGPAWNTWIGTIIPARIRTRYFGGRTRIAQVGTSVGLIGSGLVLHAASHQGWVLNAFAFMFLVAGCARLACLRFLGRQSEPVPVPPRARIVGARELLGRVRHGHDGRLLAYMACTTAAVQVVTPFLNPFMLEQLRFDYRQYVVLLAAAFIGRIIAPPFMSAFAQRFGVRRLLWLGGLGILPLSALWAVSGSFWYLLAVQVVSGAIWAAYELATFLLLFETIPQEERTSVLSAFNFANCGAILLGSMAGGALLTGLGETRDAYLLLFLISLVARLLCVALLARLHPRRVEAPHRHRDPRRAPQRGDHRPADPRDGRAPPPAARALTPRPSGASRGEGVVEAQAARP